MSSDSAAQHGPDSSDGSLPTVPESGLTDSALLEEALQAALDAHQAGLLAAPFGVDEVALKRARRRALRADIRRLLSAQQPETDV